MQTSQRHLFDSESINATASIELISRAVICQAYHLTCSGIEPLEVLAILEQRLANGNLDGDDLANLSVLDLLDDELLHMARIIPSLRREVALLKRHFAISDARRRNMPVSDRARRYFERIADLRERNAAVRRDLPIGQ